MLNRTLFILIGIVCLLSTKLNAQWIQSGGPIAGGVNQLAKSSNGKLWAVSNNGLYFSTTNGNSWQRVNKQMPFCSQVFASGDSVMVVYNVFERSTISNNAVYWVYCMTSVNNGTTWNTPVLMNNVPYNNANYYLKHVGNSFVYSPESASDVGFESTNFGQTWGPVNTLFPNNTLYKFMYSHQTAFHAESRMNFPLPAKLYNRVSFNGKISWAYTDSSMNNNLKAIGAVGNAILFFNDTNNHKILRSTNLGATYDTVLTAPVGFPTYGALVNDGDTLYAYFFNNANNYKAYKSENQGLTWISLPPHFPMLYNSRFVRIDNGDYLWQWYYGNMKYSLSLDSSVLFTNDIKAETMTRLVSSGTDLYTSNNSEVYRSSDDGNTWVNTTNKFYYNPIEDLKANRDTIVYLTNDSLFVSTNKGNTWSVHNLPFNAEVVHIVHGKFFLSNNNVSNTLYESSDLGQTWVSSSFGGGTPTGLHRLVQDQDTLFDLVIDQNTWSSTMYRYLPATNQFGLLGVTNLLSLPGSIAPNLVRCGNTWFTYGTFFSVPGPYNYSNDGLIWNIPNTNALPANAYPQPYYGKPVYANGIFYSFINDTTMVWSGNGSVWNVMPSSNNLRFQQYTHYNGYNDLVYHKDILYMSSFGSSVWRRNDTIKSFSGNVYFDANNNGIKDAGETNLKNVVVATQNAFGNTNSLGMFGLLTDQQGDSLKPTLMSPSFTSNPPYIITNNSQLSNNNFGIYGPAGLVDFSTDATNTAVFRPGFATSIIMNVHNHGTSNQASVLSLTLDSIVQVTNTNPSPSSINGNVYTWNLPPLPFTQDYYVSINIMTPANAVLGDTVTFISSVMPSNPDFYMNNNMDTLKDIIVGAYDPNDKTCKQGAFYTVDQMKNKEALEYVIRFQNTGTFPASYVRIEDTLSTLLDWSTFQVVNASHPMNYNLSGKGVVHFVYDSIQLPGMAQNEPESHGFVKYTILPKSSLAIGNVINNTAHIYFDFNTPIVTNTTSTMYTHPSLVLANDDVLPLEDYKNHILIYPNPANTSFTIHFNQVLSNPTSTLHLFDMQGKKVLQAHMGKEINTIYCGDLPIGFYFGVIYDKRGNTLSRFKIALNR